MKLATIEIDKNPCLIFRINDELGVSIETLSKAFNLKLSWSSMQEFISSDSIMQQEIAHKIEKISQEPDQYNLIKLNKVTWLPPNPKYKKDSGCGF